MKKHQMQLVAVSAACVALAFGAELDFPLFNDAATMEQLQNRLLELNDSAKNIQARADAEKRDLTEDEQKEIQQIFAAFEATEADIERRQRIDDMNARLATPNKRQVPPEPVAGTEDDDAAGQQAQNAGGSRVLRPSATKVWAQPRTTDAGKWGFRSSGEYFSAVLKSSAKGGSIDPRLIANAPTTYGQEGVGADGGFAVPPDFRTEIMRKVMGEASLLSRTDQMPTSSNGITIPKDDTTPWQSTGGIQAYWESEAGQKQQSKPALGELTLKANKIIALVPMTDELLEDAPSMAAYVNRKAPEKIDYKVNEAIIKGTGAGQPLGILNSAGTVVVPAESGQTADTVIFDNIVNMWTRLAPSSKANAVWLANADIEAQLMRMVFPGAAPSLPVYLPPGGLANAPYGTLMGRPVLTSEAMPALGDQGDLILGDMSKYLSVVKAGGVRQDVSIHVWFDYDITAFRFVLRIGGQPAWNTPIARTGGQTSRGFFIALGERS